MFIDAGWAVVDRDHYAPNITAVAIKEGLLKGNLEADYFLFINGKAVGILEAKREEVDVSNNTVCEQAALYVRSVPNCYQAYMKPLPLIYQSNGNVVQFKDYRNADSDYLELNRIHTPKEIVRMLGIKDFYAGSHYRIREKFPFRAKQSFNGVGHRRRKNLHGLSCSIPIPSLHSDETNTVSGG